MHMDFDKILEKHSPNFANENFEGWKTTEIMYCKIGWVIDAIDGNDEMSEFVNILLEAQNFISDLQEIEKA